MKEWEKDIVFLQHCQSV